MTPSMPRPAGVAQALRGLYPTKIGRIVAFVTGVAPLSSHERAPPTRHNSLGIGRYGRSLGSGPTCQLAEELAKDGVKLGGVMLQSPLASAFRVAFNFRFTLLGDLFPNIDRVKNIACPVFIIHGTR